MKGGDPTNGRLAGETRSKHKKCRSGRYERCFYCCNPRLFSNEQLGLATCSGCAETWLGKRYAARLNARHKQFPFRRQALKIARPALRTTPQTIAGLRALLEWIDWDCDGLALDEDHVH